VTIDVLPEVPLLEIFEFYIDEAWCEKRKVDAWQKLVHVCRKWRIVVFGSPSRLKLQLHCRATIRSRRALDIWPSLPIVITLYDREGWGMHNILAALQHNDRICEINFHDIPAEEDKVLAAMQQSFPELTSLSLDVRSKVDPNLFLGGSAPRLRTLSLNWLPFPRLPKLLLSAAHLVHLGLGCNPHSRYISPEAMVTGLSVFTRLECLVFNLYFESLQSRPDQKSQPPQMRALLPVLTELRFSGDGEYLEDVASRIDAPLLDKLTMAFHQPISDTPQLTRFISRTQKFKTHDKAHLVFSDWDFMFRLPQTSDGELELRIACADSDRQLSSLAQVCSSSFGQAFIPAVENLRIDGNWYRCLQSKFKSSQWLELLHPFTAVEDLYIASEFTPRIAPALQELVGERATEVLPALQTVSLGRPLRWPVKDKIEQFGAARQLAGRPIAISRVARKRPGEN
jgi:hypothetical protein